MAKILIVDDEVRIRELLRKALNREGHDVETVPGAEESLELIFKEPFDLLLLDVHLSGESGFSLLKKIRACQKDIPIIIYSGVLTPELENQAREAGANEVLSKDTELTQLILQISRFIKGKNGVCREPAKEKSILIVDDEEQIRRVLTGFFNKKGYKVIEEAGSGEEAIKLASSRKFSAVLLDINMPGMDGIATLKKLLEIDPGLGVIMISGRQDDEYINKAIELGACGYILKPFDFLYLEIIIRSKLAIAEGD